MCVEYGIQLHKLLSDGVVSWEKVASACLEYMPDEDIGEMLRNEFPELIEGVNDEQ